MTARHAVGIADKILFLVRKAGFAQLAAKTLLLENDAHVVKSGVEKKSTITMCGSIDGM